MIPLRAIRRMARGLAIMVLNTLPGDWLQNSLINVAALQAQILPPGDGLRFLFRLDAALYRVQGKLAVAYDDGIHTKHRHIRYHDFFIGRIRTGERVLDIGCGIGALAYDVAEKAGAYVVGIDLSQDNVNQARKRYKHSRVEYRVGNALQQIVDVPFDVVILSNVLEHLPERSAFLHRLQEVAQPSRILIRVPLFERDWRVPLKQELGVEWRLDPSHETEYSLESFSKEIADSGLVVAYEEVRWGEIWAEVVADV